MNLQSGLGSGKLKQAESRPFSSGLTPVSVAFRLLADNYIREDVVMNGLCSVVHETFWVAFVVA
jgi:hypothetical protein